MRALRHAAVGITTTVVLVALQVVGLLPTERLDSIPVWVAPFMALAVLTPAIVASPRGGGTRIEVTLPCDS